MGYLQFRMSTFSFTGKNIYIFFYSKFEAKIQTTPPDFKMLTRNVGAHQAKNIFKHIVINCLLTLMVVLEQIDQVEAG